MIEGSGSGSVPLTKGSGSGRPKTYGSGFATLAVTVSKGFGLTLSMNRYQYFGSVSIESGSWYFDESETGSRLLNPDLDQKNFNFSVSINFILGDNFDLPRSGFGSPAPLSLDQKIVAAKCQDFFLFIAIYRQSRNKSFRIRITSFYSNFPIMVPVLMIP